MVLQTGIILPEQAMRFMISSALDMYSDHQAGRR